MTKQEEIDTGKFFRGLAKVRDDYSNPETMRQMLELDDRLLGMTPHKAKKRGIRATLKHWWRDR